MPTTTDRILWGPVVVTGVSALIPMSPPPEWLNATCLLILTRNGNADYTLMTSHFSPNDVWTWSCDGSPILIPANSFLESVVSAVIDGVAVEFPGAVSVSYESATEWVSPNVRDYAATLATLAVFSGATHPPDPIEPPHIKQRRYIRAMNDGDDK